MCFWLFHKIRPFPQLLTNIRTSLSAVRVGSCKSSRNLLRGGTIPKTNEIVTNICSCHNFFPLSSVQIIIIPACCLLCVL